MPTCNYSLAQIYLIKSKAVKNDGWVYVSSSCGYLPLVFNRHMHTSRLYAREGKSHVLYDKIRSCWDFFILTLYERFPCENVEQLRKRENDICELLGGVSNRTDLETRKMKRNERQKQYNKKYREKKKRLIYPDLNV